MSDVREKLEEVKAIFVARFKLGPTGDSGSRGYVAIQEAIDSDTPDIAGLKRLLLEEYELYPQYAPRVRALLDACDVEDVPASAEAASDAATEEDDTASAKPLSRMTKAELLELAAERELEVSDDATVADLREALREEE